MIWFAVSKLTVSRMNKLYGFYFMIIFLSHAIRLTLSSKCSKLFSSQIAVIAHSCSLVFTPFTRTSWTNTGNVVDKTSAEDVTAYNQSLLFSNVILTFLISVERSMFPLKSLLIVIISLTAFFDSLIFIAVNMF
jgi:hypothetical protein